MNTLIALVIGVVVIYLGYVYYAKRVDAQIIKADPKKATPAKMYMDGVDFSPTDRNVLYGYQFKSIAAAGPIVGAITAANLWGWLPALLWLLAGVSLIGWVQDYGAMMMAVRKDGDSLTAIAHKLISPRTRTILLLFIFVYLLMILGAFGNLLAGALNSNPSVPLGIIVLALAVCLPVRCSTGGRWTDRHDRRCCGFDVACHPDWSVSGRQRSRSRIQHSIERAGLDDLLCRNDWGGLALYHQLYVLAPLRRRLLVSWCDFADLAICPTGELYRLLGDGIDHRRRTCRRGARRVSQARCG